MPRIPYADETRLSEAAKAQLGNVPANVSRMLAVASEPVFLAFGELGKAFINKSSLPPRLRELAILRVGYLSDSAYETFQHEALGKFVGLSEQQIAAIKAGDPAADALDQAEAAVLQFVDDIVKNVRASDATLSAVRNYLDDTQLVDLILVTGNYMMVCRLLETTGVDEDDEPIDWNAFSRS
ncbi:MAG: carboxymuconolactone decarboxylase family protein [Novosphingobium sp.]|nr:carboxymuconolactone decarboxylase family protein [Novosphingobium sp.]MCP5402512.1 carboxymuconolactone decarboxylase family protein [Novosphingobium sp.]